MLALCSSARGTSRLLLAACALNLASIVGSTLADDFERGACCESQAIPAAFRVLGRAGSGVLENFVPFFSDLNVVLIGLRWSGLGLLEAFLVVGTGNVGGVPRAVCSKVLPLLRRRIGNAGLGEEEDGI